MNPQEPDPALNKDPDPTTPSSSVFDTTSTTAPVTTPMAESSFASPTLESQPLSTPQKKSHIKRTVIISLIVVALVGAGIGYYLFTLKKPATPVATATTPAAATTTTDPSVEAAVKSLTDSSTGETTLTNIDDSSQATNASTAAGNVGDSVDENNF